RGRTPAGNPGGPLPRAPQGVRQVSQAFTIARLTLVEAWRRRLLLAMALLTLAVIVLTGWGFSFLPKQQGVTAAEVRSAAYILTVLVAFMFSGVLALGSTLVASPSIAGEIESGIVLAIAPRPLRRSEILLGKWLGLAFLVVLYAIASGVLELDRKSTRLNSSHGSISYAVFC